MFGIGLPEVMILGVIVFIVCLIGYWVKALIDILTNEFTGSNKIIWLLLVILIPISFILYFIIGAKQKIPKSSIPVNSPVRNLNMFCSNCGKEIKEGSKFCRSCGNKITG